MVRYLYKGKGKVNIQNIKYTGGYVKGTVTFLDNFGIWNKGEKTTFALLPSVFCEAFTKINSIKQLSGVYYA